jgi:hypothetical protein
MAEDFWAEFNIGYGDHTIADLDARGVAFAAIQGLNAKVEEQVATKNAEIETLKREIGELRHAVEVLMARTASEARVAQAH